MCVGDTIQQSVELHTRPGKKGYDLQRICHMGTIGLFMGPPQHFFYKYLDKYLPLKSMKSIAYKICLDQAVISPTCIIIFLGGIGYLERKPRDDIIAEIREKFLIIYSTDWMLWPPCQYVNFTYVKPKYRVMYVNVITVIYDIILSYIKYTDDIFGTKSVGEKLAIEGDRNGIENKSSESVGINASIRELEESSDKVVNNVEVSDNKKHSVKTDR